jgi:hypothetical protein
MTVENVYDPSHEMATEAAAPAALAVERDVAAASAGLEKAIAEGKVNVEPLPEGTCVFVAPVERNTTFLVNPTERIIKSINDPNSPTGQRDMRSENTPAIHDVWLTFKDGICIVDTTTKDGQKQLAWTKEHSDICRDINEPMTAAWVQMKEAQTQTARREASLPTGLDVDALLRGDRKAMRSGNVTADRARQALESTQAGK